MRRVALGARGVKEPQLGVAQGSGFAQAGAKGGIEIAHERSGDGVIDLP